MTKFCCRQYPIQSTIQLTIPCHDSSKSRHISLFSTHVWLARHPQRQPNICHELSIVIIWCLSNRPRIHHLCKDLSIHKGSLQRSFHNSLLSLFLTITAIDAGANTVTTKRAPMYHVVTMFPTITFLTPVLLHLELAIHCKLKVKDHVLIDCNLKYNVATKYYTLHHPLCNSHK